jgi:ArsR family metal-binding transcriptional regulator
MEVKEIMAFRPPCDASSEMVNVKAFLDRDVSDLMPYLKGELESVKFFPKGPYVKFVFQGHPVTIDHDCIAVAGFEDDQSARECAREVVALLKDIEARKDSITPDTTPFNPPSAMDVFKLLPRKSGCGKCGYPACMAFAVALIKQETEPEMCPALAETTEGGNRLKHLKEMLGF